MSVHVREAHLKTAQKLVDETRANGGLAPIDLDKFWADDAVARSDTWSETCPQMPLGILMSHECVWAELGIEEDWYKLLHDQAFNLELCKRYNDKAEQIVGRRIVREVQPTPPEHRWPEPKQLFHIFEGQEVWEGWSYWLPEVVNTPKDLEALLDRVEKRLEDLRSFLLPHEWDEQKERLQKLGIPSPTYRGQRGPVTFAMSIYGVENLIYLIMDEPDLAKRFSDLIARAILGRARVLDEERGWEPGKEAQRGWYWCDDNSCMLNPEMYDFFAKPIHRAVFDTYSSNPGELRGQHSDSDMAQHLPTLNDLGLNSANFGPNLTIAQIREKIPGAEIHGQMAPFTFCRNEEVNIVAECLRDFEMAREKRGVVLATAGSINNGSRVSSLRLIMAAIQRYGQYC